MSRAGIQHSTSLEGDSPILLRKIGTVPSVLDLKIQLGLHFLEFLEDL